MPSSYSDSQITLTTDPRGWPAVELNFARPMRWHLWPITWWQVEDVLADQVAGSQARDVGLLRAAYRDLLDNIERPALSELTAHQAVAISARGIKPPDAARLAGMVGGGWHLPSDGAWVAFYSFISANDVSIDRRSLLEWCNTSNRPFVRHVCGYIANIWAETIRLSDLMLLGSGLLEWVSLPNGRFAARGRPTESIIAHPLDRMPIRPLLELTTERLGQFGLRCVGP
jgi:hypothetical protein